MSYTYENTIPKMKKAAINGEKKLTSIVEQHNEATGPQCRQRTEGKKLKRHYKEEAPTAQRR